MLLGFAPLEQLSLFQTYSAILHLGNLAFVAKDSKEESFVPQDETLLSQVTALALTRPQIQTDPTTSSPQPQRPNPTRTPTLAPTDAGRQTAAGVRSHAQDEAHLKGDRRRQGLDAGAGSHRVHGAAQQAAMRGCEGRPEQGQELETVTPCTKGCMSMYAGCMHVPYSC